MRPLAQTLWAAERLRRTKPLLANSIQEIVEAAGSSVGSFYARFGNKAGRLPHLYERFDADLRRRIDGLGARGKWVKRTIEEQAR